MEVWTCKQNSSCFCADSKYIHNRRDITENGQLESKRRQSCTHLWRNCPNCYSVTPEGEFVCHAPKK